MPALTVKRAKTNNKTTAIAKGVVWVFDYFYQNQNKQYIFLQLPHMLIKDDTIGKLSDSPKILYSLLLNMTSISSKNGWKDEQGMVYIIYTIEEMIKDLNCWEQKAVKVIKELKDIGIVKSVRRGQHCAT